MNSAHVELRCEYSSDGGSQGEDTACPIKGISLDQQLNSVQWRAAYDAENTRECIPGCSTNGRPPLWCNSLSDFSGCKWRPSDLGQMMRQHEQRLEQNSQAKWRHNEIVLNPEPITHGLPGSIEAFVLPSEEGDGAKKVRDAHAAFHRVYGSRTRAPLLRYDPGGEPAFAVVE